MPRSRQALLKLSQPAKYSTPFRSGLLPTPSWAAQLQTATTNKTGSPRAASRRNCTGVRPWPKACVAVRRGRLLGTPIMVPRQLWPRALAPAQLPLDLRGNLRQPAQKWSLQSSTCGVRAVTHGRPRGLAWALQATIDMFAFSCGALTALAANVMRGGSNNSST